MDTLVHSVTLILTWMDTKIEYTRIEYPDLQACLFKAEFFLAQPSGEIFDYTCMVNLITGQIT